MTRRAWIACLCIAALVALVGPIATKTSAAPPSATLIVLTVDPVTQTRVPNVRIVIRQTSGNYPFRSVVTTTNAYGIHYQTVPGGTYEISADGQIGPNVVVNAPSGAHDVYAPINVTPPRGPRG